LPLTYAISSDHAIVLFTLSFNIGTRSLLDSIKRLLGSFFTIKLNKMRGSVALFCALIQNVLHVNAITVPPLTRVINNEEL
jgi:hypothetical protein